MQLSNNAKHALGAGGTIILAVNSLILDARLDKVEDWPSSDGRVASCEIVTRDGVEIARFCIPNEPCEENR